VLLALDFLHTQDVDIGISQELFDLGQAQTNGVDVPRDKAKAHKGKTLRNSNAGGIGKGAARRR
jgi:hypothetical protein